MPAIPGSEMMRRSLVLLGRWRGRRALLPMLALMLVALAVTGIRPAQAAPSTVALWKVYPPGWNLVAGPAGSHLDPHGETLYTLDGAVPDYQSARLVPAAAGQGYWVYYPHGA